MLKDLLFPKFCLGCGFIGTYICLRCEKKLLLKRHDTCLYCERSSPYGLTHPGCRREHGVDGVLSCYYYNSFLKKIIATCKYKLAKDVFGDFRSVLPLEFLCKLSFFKGYAPNLQAIPLHPVRLRMRGFNHAESIRDLFHPYLFSSQKVDCLKRIICTAPQARLHTPRARLENIRGAFACDSTISGRFLLIDDVVTSGHTIKEACKTLKQAGAEKVYALTLASG